MKIVRNLIFCILSVLVVYFIYTNGTYVLSRWDASTIEKNRYESIQISYQVSSKKMVVLGENSMEVVFQDRKFQKPIEDTFGFVKQGRIEEYKHTIRSHALYFFVKNYVKKHEMLSMCRTDRIINVEFNGLNGSDFLIICRNEIDESFSYKQKMDFSEDEKFLYILLVKNFEQDEQRWR